MKRVLTRFSGVLIAAAIAGCGGGSIGGASGGPGSVAVGGRGGGSGGFGVGLTSGNPVAGFTGGNATGVGAFSGAGGAGTGATAGGGGELPPCPFLQTPVCGPSACGNGRRDTCLSPFAPGCVLGQVTEACDLDDTPDTTSCASLGFPTGVSACAADCSGVDLSGCHECMPLQAPVVGCGTVPLGQLTYPAFALAATDAEVALVWIDANDSLVQKLSFARLAPDLELRSQQVLEELPVAEASESAIIGMAIAPLPTGWVVAVTGKTEVYLHVIDATGRVVARTIVDQLAQYSTYVGPDLVTRPGGRPLLLWQTSAGGRAAVIAADGRSVSSPVALPQDAWSAFGTWAQGGFTILALQSYPGNGAPLLRLDGDGQLTSTRELFPGEMPQIVGVARGTDDLRVMFWAETVAGDADLFFQRFTGAGEPLIERKPLHDPQLTYYGFSPPVGRGGDTVMLLPMGQSLGYGWLTADGDFVPATQALASAPNGWGTNLFVTRGPDLVAAWLTYDAIATGYSQPMHIGVARLVP